MPQARLTVSGDGGDDEVLLAVVVAVDVQHWHNVDKLQGPCDRMNQKIHPQHQPWNLVVRSPGTLCTVSFHVSQFHSPDATVNTSNI